MWWQLALAAAAVAAACYGWSRRRLYHLARVIPCPLRSYPIIGHTYKFIGSNQDRMKTLQHLGRIANEQGGFMSIWLGNKLFIGMTDPAAIEVVTKTCLDKDELTSKFLRTVLGNSSLIAPVNIWHGRRRINALFFSLKNLNQLVPVFNQHSRIMAELMRVEAGGGDFPILKYMIPFTFDTVCETIAGIKMNFQENPEHYILSAINEVSQLVSRRALQPWLHPDFVYHNLPIYKQFQYLVKRGFGFVDDILIKKRNELSAVSAKDNKNHNENNWINFLDLIIQASGGIKNGYSDTELREELMLMMAAGNETSAIGSSFAAVLMSRHPDVQDKVFQELSEVFGDSEREITLKDLLRLKYLEAVIKESLRLYPPVPVVVREVREDVTLPSGTTLVNGCSVLINIWATHRNSSYWGEDADQFRPERFLDSPLRHPAQFLPFSYSVRGCIGSLYAMMSEKTALAILLRRYRFLPPIGVRTEDLTSPLPVQFDFLMKAVDNFMLRIEERN